LLGALFTPRLFSAIVRGNAPCHDVQPWTSGEEMDIQPDVVAGRVEAEAFGAQSEPFR
jgi:hypothetical protein